MSSIRIKFLTKFIAFFVLFASFNSINSQRPGDRIVKILNRGWYVANMQVYYELQDNPYSKVGIQQRGSIAKNQDYAFYIPGSIDFNSGAGVVVTADAVLGVRIFSIRLLASPTCIHIWGTTLIPFWTYVDCRLF